MAKSTVTVLAEAAESVTSKTAGVVPLLPSVTVASAIESDGEVSEPSSFRMVPTPLWSAIVAPEAFERMTRNRSSASEAVSPNTVTTIRRTVCPFLNFSVPFASS